MKKITTITLFLLIPFILFAENIYKLQDGIEISRELIDIPATILAVFIVALFLLNIVRWILNYLLKSKMIDKGVSDEMAKQFLQPENNESKHQTIKWFIILIGIGVGLTIISFFQPYGIHSAAIMIFSVAFSFLAYYFYIRKSEK